MQGNKTLHKDSLFVVWYVIKLLLFLVDKWACILNINSVFVTVVKNIIFYKKIIFYEYLDLLDIWYKLHSKFHSFLHN